MSRSSKPRRKNRDVFSTEDSSPKPKKTQRRRAQKLRIIGGSMRGRTVVYHGAEFTRPMKDSVRESLFNIIGPRIKGTRAYDLFAGTGAVAFEALSRGSSNAVAIERNRQAHAFMKSTAETLGVSDKLTLMMGDTYRLGATMLGPVPPDAPLDDTPRVIFLCPPYAMWDSMTDALNGLIRLARDHSPPGSLIIAETEKHFDPEKLLAGDWDHRMYGNTRLSVLEPEMVCGLRL